MQRKKFSNIEWRQMRRIVLARDRGRCVACGEDIALPKTAHIHHVLPRSAGGADAPANLVSLCEGCHAAQHPNQGMTWMRRSFRNWCYRLAKLCDRNNFLPEGRNFDAILGVFGKKKFRAGQLPLITAALKADSVLYISPTGSGKSLCFQLPAVMQPRYSVVISPLKALMGDQVSNLLRQKIPANFINSDLSAEERARFYQYLRYNIVKLAYMTPERFFTRSEYEQQILAQLRPAFLIIDEAHCVDRWGAAFRPEYARLGEVRTLLGNPPVLAFTATAGKEMQNRIAESLGIKKDKIFIRNIDRPNIALIRIKAAAMERSEEIFRLLSLPAMSGKKAMIFVPTVKIGKMLQEDLKNFGMALSFYHAHSGNAFLRQELVKRFKGESLPRIDWLICTKAFGMGLDIPDVRMVIHWQQPNSVEDYVQEYGRAGRDGKQAVAVIFHGEGGTRINERHDDISLLEFMAKTAAEQAFGENKRKTIEKNGEISPQEEKNLKKETETIEQNENENIEELQRMIDGDFCFRRALSAYFSSGFSEIKKRHSVLNRFALWLADRLYVEKPSKDSYNFCCDFCEKIKRRSPMDIMSGIGALLDSESKNNP